MIYKFNAYGHPNILAMHKTTLEFTKDENVSLKGDCIVGVNADFELKELNKFIKNSKTSKITITLKPLTQNKKYKKIQENVIAQINPKFDDNKELVIRKTDFVSERTFAISSNKAAFEVDRELIRFLKSKENKICVFIRK